MVARAHRHRATQRAAHRGDDLARARVRRARAHRRACYRRERRHVQSSRGTAPACSRRGAQCDRRVFGALVNVKHVFVVDPDIDIFSDEQMDWALATRFQADRDLVVMDAMRALPLDPSLAGGRTGAKAGFDLAWPFGSATGIETRVPEPPRFAGARFPSVEAALAHGPKFFEELMAAVGSRDGREIVLALDALRAKGLDRDGEGRYFLQSK